MPIALRAVAFYTRHESIVPSETLRWVGLKGSRWGFEQRRAYSRSAYRMGIGVDASRNTHPSADLAGGLCARGSARWSRCG